MTWILYRKIWVTFIIVGDIRDTWQWHGARIIIRKDTLEDAHRQTDENTDMQTQLKIGRYANNQTNKYKFDKVI